MIHVTFSYYRHKSNGCRLGACYSQYEPPKVKAIQCTLLEWTPTATAPSYLANFRAVADGELPISNQDYAKLWRALTGLALPAVFETPQSEHTPITILQLKSAGHSLEYRWAASLPKEWGALSPVLAFFMRIAENRDYI